MRSLDFLIGAQCYHHTHNDPAAAQASKGSTQRLRSFGRYVRQRLADKRLADEVLRTLLTAAVLICIVGLMTLAQIFSDRWFDMYSRNLMLANEPRPGDVPIVFNATTLGALAVDNSTRFATDPLFDHVFTLLPDRSDLRGWLPDALLTSFLAISLIVTLLFPASVRIARYQSFVVGRRVMWSMSLLYTFRMCSFLVTTVPSPVHNCVPKYPQDPTAYLFFIGNMATGQISACTDNIYSGHTALVTVLLFMNITYSGRWYFIVYSFFHAAAVPVTILLTRLHYSVDVLIALFMTSFVWCVYHFLLLIFIDQYLLRRESATVGQLQLERRLITRMTSRALMRALAWMDGIDFRLPQLYHHPDQQRRRPPGCASTGDDCSVSRRCDRLEMLEQAAGSGVEATGGGDCVPTEEDNQHSRPTSACQSI